MSHRQDLEWLVADHAVGCGKVRLTARFTGGVICWTQIRLFKIPPGRVETVTLAGVALDDDRRHVLEELAAKLGLDQGLCELIAEYEDRGEGPVLYSLDMVGEDV